MNKPLSKELLETIKAGDIIERMLGGTLPCYLKVAHVTEDRIDACWVFDRKTGLEIDEDIPMTVSYIRRVLNEDQIQLLKNGAKDVPL